MTQADENPFRAAGQRLRRRRLEVGLTAREAARNAGVSLIQWQVWEVGSRPYPVRRLASIAAALGVPIASLLVDQVVLAELRLSDETLERVKREGRPAAEEIANRLAGSLAAALLAEATRPPVDLSPGARAKPRRTREQTLASYADATLKAKAKRERARAAREIAATSGGGSAGASDVVAAA